MSSHASDESHVDKGNQKVDISNKEEFFVD